MHTYSAWERGTNENFNKLLGDFMPKGKSLKNYTSEYIADSANRINKRIIEVIGYKSAEEKFISEVQKISLL